MPCIFGFGFHEKFCPCELVNKSSDLGQLVCDQCNFLLQLEYGRFTSSPNQKDWDGDFQDFVGVFIEDRLKILEYRFHENDECDLSDREYELADEKFQRMSDMYFENEEKRFEARVESGEITLENEVLNRFPNRKFTSGN